MPKSPTRVAIVDDEPSVRQALARLLSASSFEIKTYGSAREFINSTLNELPECLLLDLHMPEFTGLDLLRYLKRKHEHIPTIVMTAFDDSDIRQRCAEFGAKAFLTKPLHGPTLIKSIHSATASSATAS